MKKDVADKWVAALRSGEYKQTRSLLKDSNGYCCLGVLCEIVGQEFSVDYNGGYRCDGHQSSLPPKVRELSGLGTDFGDRPLAPAHSLSAINDNGKAFSEIADIIEKEWESL